MREVDLYTDGACSYNPGPGGWAAILVYKGHEKILTGYNPETTNNRMELTAAMMGMRALKERCIVNIYTDSAYLCNAFREGWMDIWSRNGWQNSKKKEIENKDIWMDIYNLTIDHDVRWHKVKGHSDHEYNIRCDALAREEIVKHKKQQ